MVDFSAVKCFLLDLDGTVYLSGKLIKGAKKAIERMRKRGRVLFVTNNSSLSRKDYFDKLNALGLNAALEDIYTSANAAEDYISENLRGKKVYLLGTDSLKTEFKQKHIALSENKADVVVIAFDTSLTYQKLLTATRLIGEGALFLATHPDPTCPSRRGIMPDVGSFLALIKTATGRDPDLIFGKPFYPYASAIKKMAGVESGRIAMFGDRLLTDVGLAKTGGFNSVLVLSGKTTLKELNKSDVKPDLVINSLADWDKP